MDTNSSVWASHARKLISSVLSVSITLNTVLLSVSRGAASVSIFVAMRPSFCHDSVDCMSAAYAMSEWMSRPTGVHVSSHRRRIVVLGVCAASGIVVDASLLRLCVVFGGLGICAATLTAGEEDHVGFVERLTPSDAIVT